MCTSAAEIIRKVSKTNAPRMLPNNLNNSAEPASLELKQSRGAPPIQPWSDLLHLLLTRSTIVNYKSILNVRWSCPFWPNYPLCSFWQHPYAPVPRGHKHYIEKVLLRRFPLRRFLAKTLRVNKYCREKLLKNQSFGVDVKL